MTEREARIAFNLIPTVGAVTFQRLLAETQGDAAAAWDFYPQKYDWEGKEPDWQREIERARKLGIKILTEVDDAYPAQLKTISSPPLALYVVGDVTALARAGVALIGTRHCTDYGRDVAERLAFGLAKRGWCVVSGLAHGIDTFAHKGALAAEGVTVGVLGGAIDQFYPRENRELARQMVHGGGCVISEFPLGRSPDPQTFPQRNRIVSGLSRGVVAVECPLHSGTLITCSRAVEQGRAVMAVPGRIDWRTSEGCHHLIREGARMVTCVDDIVEELTPMSKGKPKPQKPASSLPSPATPKPEEPLLPLKMPKSTTNSPENSISPDEALILTAVTAEGISLDRIVLASGLTAARVSSLVVGLRLKGRLRLLSGNRVCLPKNG